MKYLAILPIILISISLLGFFYYEEKVCAEEQGWEHAKSGGSGNSLIACTLTSSEMVERKKTLLSTIQPLIEDIKELENGYVFRFSNKDDVLPQLLEVIDLENRCCS